MIVSKKRKGISTFIATLLLMVLAVSAGVVIYAYTMGYLGGFGGPQTMGALSIDASNLDSTVDATEEAAVVYIRNIGKAAFQCDTVYIGGKLTATQAWQMEDESTGHPVDATIIGEGRVGVLRILQNATSTNPNYFLPTTTYEIKIIGKDNTQLVFNIKD